MVSSTPAYYAPVHNIARNLCCVAPFFIQKSGYKQNEVCKFHGNIIAHTAKMHIAIQ